MNKIIASLAAFALVAVTVIGPVNAAGVAITVTSPDRQTFTVALPAGVDLEAADVITLKITTASNGNAVDLSGNAVTTATLGAGAAETLTNDGDANGVIVITEGGDDEAAGADLVFALTSALTDNTAYVVAYSDTDSNFSAAIVSFGTASTVAVTATVDPVLTFSIAGGNVDFGSLNPVGDNVAATQTTVAFSTNATSGIVLSGSAVGGDTGTTAGALGIAGSTSVIPAIGGETNPTAFNDAAEYFAVDLQALAATAGAVNADNAFSSADNGTADRANALSGVTALVGSVLDPVAASFNVRYHVGIVPTTDAGSYSGTVTYTAT
ncbi:MAG: hypothetical protein HYS45_01680, partial [Parcubacteria group bacterium]|nr:hypothetical protein [Parcubacteria group bacterium]